jgi:hypothetical protein
VGNKSLNNLPGICSYSGALEKRPRVVKEELGKEEWGIGVMRGLLPIAAFTHKTHTPPCRMTL